jgi:hypothetical protein
MTGVWLPFSFITSSTFSVLVLWRSEGNYPSDSVWHFQESAPLFLAHCESYILYCAVQAKPLKNCDKNVFVNNEDFNIFSLSLLPIPVAEWSKAWVCSRSPAGIVGSNGCLSVVSVVCLSGRGLCDGLITRPEESYRLCCVVVCDLEISRMRRLKPASGLWKSVEEEVSHSILSHQHSLCRTVHKQFCKADVVRSQMDKMAYPTRSVHTASFQQLTVKGMGVTN